MSVRWLLALALVATAAVACDSTASPQSDAAAYADGCGPVSDAISAASDSTATVPSYTGIVIRDRSADPSFINGKCGASPGMDLDCVGLWRAGKLIAVGMPNAATYTAPPPPSCANAHDVTATATGPLDGHMGADSTQDSGYISLNGGAIAIQFGACNSGTTILDCDGLGGAVTLLSGDEIDVWEIDANYFANSDTAADGNAWDGCPCYAGEYEVDLRPTAGAAIVLPTRCDANSADGRSYAGSHTVKVP